MSLNELLAGHTAEERAEAMKVYRGLLLRWDTGTTADALELHEIAAVLGKSMDDVRADAAAVKKAGLLRKSIDALPYLEDAHTKAASAKTEALRRMEQVKKEAELAWKKAQYEEDDAFNKMRDSQLASSILARLIDANLELLGGSPATSKA